MMNILLAAVVCTVMIAMIEYVKYSIKKWYKSEFDAYKNPRQKSL